MENDANPNPALIQPMDQNVIQNIKLGYRKLLLTTILNDPLHNESLEKTQTNESQVALYQRIREVFLQDGHRLKIINHTNRVDDGIPDDGILDDRILDDVAAGKTIYIDDSHHLASMLLQNQNTCRIAIAPDRFVAKELAFGLRKGSSLLQPLNEQSVSILFKLHT
ncbi:hypothetical protein AVEN_259695-1 [Araneus ventricosus]|uniref:Uncharacterized protein n=1 Tax=Araneus ventricosus TaxID=182803 RepID=A0A4Y2PN06_ARAVE|nr:hypothetical protein AVEN_259695-1 [Araneus ventricosus]